MNLRQVAEFLGVGERTVHQMRADGRLPEPLVLGVRCLRWLRGDLIEHIRAIAPRGIGTEPVAATAAAAKRRAACKA